MILYGGIICLKYRVGTMCFCRFCYLKYVFGKSMILFCDYRFVLYSRQKLIFITWHLSLR